MSGALGASDNSLDALPQYPLSSASDNADMIGHVVYVHGSQGKARSSDQRGSWHGIPTKRWSSAFLSQRRFPDKSFLESSSERRTDLIDEFLQDVENMDENNHLETESTYEQSDRTNRALERITDDYTAPPLVGTQRRADLSAHTWTDGRTRAVDSTYGVVHLRSQRHSTLYTIPFVVGQCVCCWVLRNYGLPASHSHQNQDYCEVSSNIVSWVRP
jgi:hypothetical protein